MRGRRLVAAAAVLALVGVAGVAQADPSPSPAPSTSVSPPPASELAPGAINRANILQCTFGDSFYEFVSDYAYLDNGYYNGQIVGSDAIVKLNTDADGSWFCQVGYEWMDLTGNNLCLTLNWNQQLIDVITCQNLASQRWQLFDNDGTNALGHDWGGLQSLYTNHGNLYMAMDSTQQSHFEEWYCCWNDNDIYGYTLDGPYAF